MERAVEVGGDDLLTVFELSAPAADGDLGEAIEVMRACTLNAVGVLCAVLDDRIALEQLAEDVILLQDGVPVAAADLRSRVRTFMPFDVTDDDRTAISSLSGLTSSAARRPPRVSSPRERRTARRPRASCCCG